MPTELDSFETKLLAELRSEIATRAPQRRSGRRWLAVAAAAAAVGLTSAGVLLTTNATPAYALTPHADGSVTVTVNRLEGADALEAALAREGITADVTYTEPGTMCAPGRYTEATPPDSWMQVVSDLNGSQSITVPASVAGSGLTLVLESSWQGSGQQETWVLGVGYASGAVGTCEQLPAEQVIAQLPREAPEPTITRDDTPTFTGPWADEFTRTWQETTTERQRAILADEAVTDAEYAELTDAFSACMAGKGYDVAWNGATGGFTATSTDGTEPDNLGAVVDACERETSGMVPALADQIKRNPDHLDEFTIMAACLVRLGAVDAGYTADDYAHDMASPGRTVLSSDEFVTCNAAPLHAQP